MLAQDSQHSSVLRCIWNPLSPLLEALQNHSGYEAFFPSVVASQLPRQHKRLFLRRDVGICGPKVTHAGAWLVELHFIRESHGEPAEPCGSLGSRKQSLASFFSWEGKQHTVFCLWGWKDRFFTAEPLQVSAFGLQASPATLSRLGGQRLELRRI